MPLPTRWHPVPHVGIAREQGSDPASCAHPQGSRLFCALSLRTGKLIHSLGATFTTFLKTLLRQRAYDTRMVQDNAWYHHVVFLRPLVRTYRAMFTMLFLLPYSRQLAPVERVWKLASCMPTHNQFIAILDDVLIAAFTCFDRWRITNLVLRRLCGIS
jgi:DDE superfamily endonuclease